MRIDLDEEKSFDPQLLPEGEPNPEWGIEQLGVYSQLQHRTIVAGEKSLTSAYWRLGQALDLALKNLPRGHRGKYLKRLGIDKTRASKARAIARTFGSEEEVRDLSVDDAYAQRRQKKQQQEPQQHCESAQSSSSEEIGELRKFVRLISKRTETLIDAAGFAEPAAAEELLPSFREAVGRLVELVRHLERQAELRSPEVAMDSPKAGQTI
jgi:hypothetical protein